MSTREIPAEARKSYRGLNGHDVYVERGEYSPLPLTHRVRHSPTGFSWGYGGSGPADLALSILWDYLDREPDAALYQDFKHEVVANWREQHWTLSSEEIDRWIDIRSGQ